MDDNLKNENKNIHDETILENYDAEVIKKISFWANLIYKIKNGKNQKFLPSTELKPQKTYKSIFYMWNMGNLKISLFNKLDSVRNIFVNSIHKNNINSLEAQIIGKGDSAIVLKDPQINFIIPKPINLKKSIEK